MAEIIRITQAQKTFTSDDRTTKALNNISLSVQSGEFVVLLGASGSGKSTLIRSLCGLETLDKAGGEIVYNAVTLQKNGVLTPTIRQSRKTIGVIFQQFNLISQLNVLDNVLIGLVAHKSWFDIILKNFTKDEKALALDCLDRVGLADFAYQRASTLSGGQQQRVAIARALIRNIDLLLADEPVASLDPESSRLVMDSLQELAAKFNLTLIVSLHQVEIALRYAERIIALKNGSCIFDDKASSLEPERLQSIYVKDNKRVLAPEFAFNPHSLVAH
jgi:phosphonate transport system ATP-binding protein